MRLEKDSLNIYFTREFEVRPGEVIDFPTFEALVNQGASPILFKAWIRDDGRCFWERLYDNQTPECFTETDKFLYDPNDGLIEDIESDSKSERRFHKKSSKDLVL